MNCKKILSYVLLILISFFILRCHIFAQSLKDIDISVSSSLTPCVTLIGSKISIEISVNSDELWQIEFIDDNDSLKDFTSIKSFEPKITLKKDRKITLKKYEFSIFDVGKHIIKPIKIKCTKKDALYTTNSSYLFLKVNSLLNQDENNIRDIVPFVLLPKKMNLLIIAIYIAVFFIIIFVIWFFKFRRKQKEIEVIVKKSWEIAFEQLDILIAQNLFEKKLGKEYVFQLSNILRHYIENRFDLMAPERTTEEFIQIMQKKNVFSELHQKLLKAFLIETDLIKFAKKEPNKDDTDKGTYLVRSFITETVEQNNHK